jgi:hypothetical protein
MLVATKKSTVVNKALSIIDKSLNRIPKIEKVNTYHNKDGVNKKAARKLMVKYILSSKVDGLVPTLPHIECAIETKLLSKNKNLSFIGVERELATYEEMKKTIKSNKLPIEPFFGDMGTQLYGKFENTYAHLILDYCGMLPTFAKELEYSVRNNIVKVNGIIAMTFAKPIRGNGQMFDYVKSLGMTISNNEADNRCMSDKATEAYFNKITGFNYTFVEMFNYMDTYPMTLVILRRDK